MFDFANTFLQKSNRIQPQATPPAPLPYFVQTMLCRKQQRGSHCFGLKLKIKTFCLCFLLNTTHLYPEYVIKVSFQPVAAAVTWFLPKLPALSCRHPLPPLSSWLQNIKRKQMSVKLDRILSRFFAGQKPLCHRPNQEMKHHMPVTNRQDLSELCKRGLQKKPERDKLLIFPLYVGRDKHAGGLSRVRQQRVSPSILTKPPSSHPEVWVSCLDSPVSQLCLY